MVNDLEASCCKLDTRVSMETLLHNLIKRATMHEWLLPSRANEHCSSNILLHTADCSACIRSNCLWLNDFRYPSINNKPEGSLHAVYNVLLTRGISFCCFFLHGEEGMNRAQYYSVEPGKPTHTDGAKLMHSACMRAALSSHCIAP